jgi:hypothetical protein
MSLSLNPTPQQMIAWSDFARRETSTTNPEFARMSEKDFRIDRVRQDKLNFFNFYY